MLAVVVPAHDDQDRIGACLQSLYVAAASPALRGEATLLIVALDGCSDRTAEIARRWGAFTVEAPERSSGGARALAERFAIEAGARWWVTTGADSVVAPDWLQAQVAPRPVRGAPEV